MRIRVPLGRLPWLVVILLLLGALPTGLVVGGAGCGDDGTKRPPPGDGDGDTDADADGDTDTDADADADADTDGDTDADTDADGDVDVVTHCDEDGDCTLVQKIDQCCACPIAATELQRAADACLVPWPPAGEPPVGCSLECGACPEPGCPTPAAARCREQRCTVELAGDCVDANDCNPGERCVFVDGAMRCRFECETHDDCQGDYWCGRDADGYPRCLQLEYGQCVRQEDCDQGHCEGATDSAPGTCVN